MVRQYGSCDILCFLCVGCTECFSLKGLCFSCTLLLIGVAVMAVMLVTTLMVTLIMLATWQTSLVGAGIFYIFYTIVEGVFWSANLYRVRGGG